MTVVLPGFPPKQPHQMKWSQTKINQVLFNTNKTPILKLYLVINDHSLDLDWFILRLLMDADVETRSSSE